MALNKYMHSRNIYKSKKPNFQQLALKYDYFKEKVTVNLSGNVILDFKDPSALRALTRALLEDDFDLKVELPLDRLIPTVPQRLNYILWIEDIIGAQTQAHGVDIGTGASCIYPLLGCRHNGWKFLASDVDDQNLLYAKENVKRNQMEDSIKVQKVAETTMLKGLLEEGVTYDFCMCNPPFFTDHLEAQGVSNSRKVDRADPHSVSTASECESIAWGGEVRFVIHMIDESLTLKERIRVYTSMLGKKTSIQLLKDYLHKKQVTNFSTTEFCQGRTMRWGIAWSFSDSIHFPKSAFKQLKNTKPPLTYIVPRTVGVVPDYTVQAYTQYIRTSLELLKINYHIKHSGKFYSCLLIQAHENTWSNQRQKRRQKRRSAETVANTLEVAAATTDGTHDVDRVENGAQTDAMTTDVSDDVAMETDAVGVVDVDSSKTSGEMSSKQSDEASVKTTDDSFTGQKGVHESSASDAQKRKLDESVKNVNDDNKDVGLSKDELSGGPPPKKLKEDLDIPTATEDTKPAAVEDVGSDDIKQANTDINETTGDCTTLNGDFKINPGNNEFNNFKDEIDKSRAKFMKQTESKVSNGSEKQSDTLKDAPKPLLRKDIVKQFWEEMEARQKEQGIDKKDKPKSEFDKAEPFSDTEPCLVLAKLVIKKDEGVISLILTYQSGNKEALHQILQYFKNKLDGEKSVKKA